MYLRKSSEDKERQIRSIPDQKADCELMAERLGLNVVAVIKDEKSAKSPNQRENFTNMLGAIKKGTYDGILAWHPDRLARNMKEAGEIIDLIDNEYIKDLKFVTHHFTNDPSGKMLLGIAFVLSKQYTDKLSVDVTRGVRGRLKEGKTPTPKHGYINEDGIYRPDGKNHELIKLAWQMKKEGSSHEVIADEINSQGFHRKYKDSERVSYMTKQKLSEMFDDSFYFGVLVQSGQTVDLRELYDFEPAVREEDYFLIQRQKSQRIVPYNTKQRKAFYPFVGLLRCGFCGNNLVVGPSTSGDKKTRLLYCRCDNKDCLRYQKTQQNPKGLRKSVRMKYILEFIYDLLDKGLGFTEKEYKDYYKNLKSISDQRKIKLRSDLNNKRGVVKRIEQEAQEISLALIKSSTNQNAKKYAENELESLVEQKNELIKSIKKLEEKLSNSDTEEIGLEQFLNLSKNAPVAVKNGSPVVKDTICRFIFLNIDVGVDEILSYQLKEPFATLLKQREILNGRGDRT